MCHEDDESCCHSVISPSPPLPPPLPSSPCSPTALSLPHWTEHFFLLTRQTRIARTCRRMVRGAREHCHFILAHAAPSDRDVKPPLSQKQQAPHQQTCTCRCVTASLSEVAIMFFFYFSFSPPFLTFFFSFPVGTLMRRIQMGLFPRTLLLKALMEYDMLIIFPGPWQIALTAYYACFLTFVLFVSLPQWPLNLGCVGNGR